MLKDPELKKFQFSLRGLTMTYQVWLGKHCSFIQSTLEDNGLEITHLIDTFVEEFKVEVEAVIPWKVASYRTISGLETTGVLVVHKSRY